jgi:hypothetical protein
MLPYLFDNIHSTTAVFLLLNADKEDFEDEEDEEHEEDIDYRGFKGRTLSFPLSSSSNPRSNPENME